MVIKNTTKNKLFLKEIILLHYFQVFYMNTIYIFEIILYALFVNPFFSFQKYKYTFLPSKSITKCDLQ